MREIGSEYIEKHDNAALMRSKMAEEDKSVTEVHSSTLQQQLARNKAKSAAPKEAVVYSVGDTVQHVKFGKGTVQSVKPMGNDLMLEVSFEDIGTKKIMANYTRNAMKKI